MSLFLVAGAGATLFVIALLRRVFSRTVLVYWVLLPAIYWLMPPLELALPILWLLLAVGGTIGRRRVERARVEGEQHAVDEGERIARQIIDQRGAGSAREGLASAPALRVSSD